jgi:tetratricopeptide (TPR) repeat protein
MLKTNLLVIATPLLLCFSTTAEAIIIKRNINNHSEKLLLAQPTYYRIWHDNERILRQNAEHKKYIRRLALELTSKRDYIGLGSLYYSNGYMREAIEAYSKAIEANPRDSDSYFLRGRVKGDQNDLSGAIADYSSVISLSPESDGAYRNRALAKYKLKDKNGSLQDFRSAARIERARGDIPTLKDTIGRIQYFFKVPE